MLIFSKKEKLCIPRFYQLHSSQSYQIQEGDMMGFISDGCNSQLAPNWREPGPHIAPLGGWGDSGGDLNLGGTAPPPPSSPRRRLRRSAGKPARPPRTAAARSPPRALCFTVGALPSLRPSKRGRLARPQSPAALLCPISAVLQKGGRQPRDFLQQIQPKYLWI
jgi:hypothetical protein